jgi:hypothetical protein
MINLHKLEARNYDSYLPQILGIVQGGSSWVFIKRINGQSLVQNLKGLKIF